MFFFYILLLFCRTKGTIIPSSNITSRILYTMTVYFLFLVTYIYFSNRIFCSFKISLLPTVSFYFPEPLHQHSFKRFKYFFLPRNLFHLISLTSLDDFFRKLLKRNARLFWNDRCRKSALFLFPFFRFDNKWRSFRFC